MNIFAVIHIVISAFLILIVMMQGSKSEGLSGFFGGGGSTLLGTGTPSFLAKVTTVLGIIFMLSAISFTIVLSRKPSSVMERTVIEQKIPAHTGTE